ELVIAENRAEDFPELLLLSRPDFQPELLFDCRLSLRRDHVLELATKRFAHRRIELQGLGHAHAMDFAGDNEQTRPGEEIDHVSRPASRKPKVLRFDQNQSALRFFCRLVL